MKKTAGIYDRWLFTLGGGEQVAFAYAETLRDLGYQTALLTHKKIDRVATEKKMGVSLKDIELRYLPESSSKELAEYSEKYDIFINTSYLDYFPNRSRLGLLSVFFPGQIFLTPYEYIKRALLVPSFRTFFIYPSRFEGFKYDEYKNGRIYKWLSKESSIVFNKNIKKLRLALYYEDLAFSVLDTVVFTVEGIGKVVPTSAKLKHQSNTITYTFDFGKASIKNRRFSICLPESPYAQKVALMSLTILDIRYILYNCFKYFFPKWEMRLHGGAGVTKRSDLESYKKIVTISNFCRKWIINYWGLPSVVLYPPVNIKNFYSAPSNKKKNHIIHVGRFFVTGHSKKQLDMAKAFKQMIDENNLKDWELHFVGSIYEGKKHQEYFEQTQFEAQGYPVFFHTQTSFAELKDLLAEAKIYWHATGLDEDGERSPILLEHFGITTVEAMASGCVPVVINAGGQPEIVTQESGFLWNTRRELIEKTLVLIKDAHVLQKYSKQAQERSRYFSRENFKKRFQAIIDGRYEDAEK